MLIIVHTIHLRLHQKVVGIFTKKIVQFLANKNKKVSLEEKA